MLHFAGGSDIRNTIRLHYYSLYFGNASGKWTKCYEDSTNFQTPIPMPSTVECRSKASGIQFFTFKPSPYDGGQVFLEICEVQIYGKFEKKSVNLLVCFRK